MRRHEREITDPSIIRSVFDEGDICRLGLIDNKLAYIVPMNFGYENGYIYFHSAEEGKKIDILKENPEASFEIDINHRVRESKTACNWSASYLSVIGSGKIEFIHDPVDKVKALNVIMEKYSGRKDWPFTGKMIGKTSIFRLVINNIFCKGSK